MPSLYKICSFVYRLLLLLIIPADIGATVIAGTAGHNRGFNTFDYLAWIFIVLTVTMLTMNAFILNEHRAKRIVRYASIICVSISIAVELYGVYDFFSDADLSAGGPIGVVLGIISLFIFISLIVLRGLLTERLAY